MTTPSPIEEHLAAHVQAGRTERSLEQIAARLESRDATHRQDMANLRQDMATIHRRLDTLEATHRQDMASLRQDMASLQQDMASLQQDMASLQQDMASLQQDMATIHRRFEALEATHRQDMASLRQEHRRDFRWLIGIQITTLIALGTLILTRLPG